MAHSPFTLLNMKKIKLFDYLDDSDFRYIVVILLLIGYTLLSLTMIFLLPLMFLYYSITFMLKRQNVKLYRKVYKGIKTNIYIVKRMYMTKFETQEAEKSLSRKLEKQEELKIVLKCLRCKKKWNDFKDKDKYECPYCKFNFLVEVE